MFVLIYELDDESEVDDPAMWIKANPNIDVSVDREKLASTIQKARGIPSQWVEMLTKRFNIWCQGLRRGWVTVHGRSAPERSRRRIYTGRSATRGWTYHQPAIFPACAMPSRSVKNYAGFRHYLPEFQLQNPANKNRAIYRQWVKAGWIRTTPGDCIDYDRIRDDIMADAENFSIRLVGFDTWNATHLRTQLQGRDLRWSRSRKHTFVSVRRRNRSKFLLTGR